MKMIQRLMIIFLSIFFGLFLHAFLYEKEKKVDEIRGLASDVKHTELSSNFKSHEYKRFVYAE